MTPSSGKSKKQSRKQKAVIAAVKLLTQPLPVEKTVKPKSKKAPKSSVSKVKLTAEEKRLQAQVNAAGKREKEISEKFNENAQKAGKVNKPIPLNEMNEEQQRAAIFNAFPGDQMGIVVGKPDPRDPYRAMIPKEAKTK